MIENLSYMIAPILSTKLLIILFLGTLFGLILGVLPGLGPTTGGALILPFTITLDPLSAIVLLTAIYCAGTYGGAITAVLINTPGTPAAAATCLDGYPLAQKGEAGRALGMATFGSAFGGLFSVVVLVLFAPILANIAYEFGQPEYFALAIFGLTMLASIGEGSPIKNLIAGAFGILLSTVGKDIMASIDRFTFGVNELTEGIGFIPVVVGMFAMSELLVQSNLTNQIFERIAMKAVRLPSKDDFKYCFKTILRSSGIGSFIGILPAEGGTVASLIGYSEAKRWSKKPEEFGKGAIDGIAGAETANNAATGGAMVPTLALGIPGSATTAVILTGLIIHGLRPGPDLFKEQPEFLYGIFGAMFFANILFFIFGFFGAKIFARITLIPNRLLWPMIFTLSVCGTYSLNQSFTDVFLMIGFGIIGYVMRKFGFSVVPVIIGLILGQLVELTLRQSLVIFDGNWTLFFTRPIVVTFFILSVVALIFPNIRKKNK
ncbi:tripartite tricarboxylate transporter permease [Candidatus Pelagibacter sp. HIMB1517]|uniref:tripartite tricarboxylate transporter permease n=1 Tax=Candidatus Pelagibacter sp. HIMB1517 TaxID=3413341 RepID=UPI003F84853C